MPKQVVIISKFFLPQATVDSNSVYQMIAGILKVDSTIDIHVVTSDTSYKTDLSDVTKEPDHVLENISVHRIRFRNPAASLTVITLLANLILGFKLVIKAKSLRIKNIISLSNPPLIAMWGALLLRKYNYFYWTFDLFPDAFVADELVGRQNPLFHLFNWLNYKNPPSALICLGDYQYNYVSKKFGINNIPYIKLPCGIHQNELVCGTIPEWHREDVIIVGYVGNIGRAHSISFLKNVISELANRSGILLILSVYGHHRQVIMEHVSNLKAGNITIVKYIDKEDLSFIHVHLVSLKESWNNISVPSKAVSAVCSGGVLWFCGPANSDTGAMFKEMSYISDETVASVRNTLSEISYADIQVKQEKSLEERTRLIGIERSAYNKIVIKLVHRDSE